VLTFHGICVACPLFFSASPRLLAFTLFFTTHCHCFLELFCIYISLRNGPLLTPV
jgi:hypothetical protein